MHVKCLPESSALHIRPWPTISHMIIVMHLWSRKNEINSLCFINEEDEAQR